VNPGGNPDTVAIRGRAAGFLSWYSRPIQLGEDKYYACVCYACVERLREFSHEADTKSTCQILHALLSRPILHRRCNALVRSPRFGNKPQDHSKNVTGTDALPYACPQTAVAYRWLRLSRNWAMRLAVSALARHWREACASA